MENKPNSIQYITSGIKSEPEDEISNGSAPTFNLFEPLLSSKSDFKEESVVLLQVKSEDEEVVQWEDQSEMEMEEAEMEDVRLESAKEKHSRKGKAATGAVRKCTTTYRALRRPIGMSPPPESEVNGDEEIEVYSCRFCPHKTADKAFHESHSKAHTDSLYHCQHCQFTSPYLRGIKIHAKSHTKIASEKSLQRHTERNANNMEKRVARQERRSERNRLKKIMSGKGKDWRCEFCHIQFTDIDSLRGHMQKHGGELFECSLCEFRCAKRNEFLCHVEGHKRDKSFECRFCDFRCEDGATLLVHTKRHEAERNSLGCDRCDFTCNDRVDLVIHQRVHQEDCPSETRMSEEALIRTLQGDSRFLHRAKAEPGFACGLCDFRAWQRKPFLDHLREHEKQKNFACSLCPFECASANDFMVHTKRHDCERRFVCGDCTFQTKDHEAFVYHTKSHKAAVSSYIPESSDEALESTVDLGIEYDCGDCPFQTGDREEFLSHMENH